MSLVYGDTKDAVKNRKNFLSILGIDYQDLVCPRQVHSSQIRYVKEEDKGKGALSDDSSIADTDALITDKRRLPLAIFTADCLPIFLYDSQRPAIGLIHAGWRSSQEDIVTKAVQLMKDKFNTLTKDLYVGFGPAIRVCCYEVNKEFDDLFTPLDNSHLTGFTYGLIKKNNRYYLDLVEINKKQILDLGLRQTNIFDSQLCTSCHNEEFFSYRKEGKACGRIMSVVMLR